MFPIFTKCLFSQSHIVCFNFNIFRISIFIDRMKIILKLQKGHQVANTKFMGRIQHFIGLPIY